MGIVVCIFVGDLFPIQCNNSSAFEGGDFEGPVSPDFQSPEMKIFIQILAGVRLRACWEVARTDKLSFSCGAVFPVHVDNLCQVKIHQTGHDRRSSKL